MVSKPVGRVFITDGHWRKTLAATRALGIKGINVTVGESTRLSASSFSRYCKRSVVYPSPLDKRDAFVDFLFKELSRSTYRMILAMEDETLALVSKNLTGLSRLTYVPVVSYEKLRFVQDKGNILRLAESKGIPIPKTWFINDLSELAKLSRSIPFVKRGPVCRPG